MHSRCEDAPAHPRQGWLGKDLPSGRAAEPGIARIAVLRANALGDLVFALPALESLRAAYPEPEIVLLGRRLHEELLVSRPSPVDRVVVIPSQTLMAVDDGFFDRMRAERFDIALQLHGGGWESNPFTRRLGARLTAGLRAPGAEPLDRWIPYVNGQHELLRHLEVVGLVGAAPDGLEPHLAVTAGDVDESVAIVPLDSRPLVAVHPGATDPRRRWPADRFGTVARQLVAAGARVVVTGTAEEASLTEQVASAIPGSADLAGRLTLRALVGLLSRCRVVIANDTGPLHLAAAVGVATVGIYWCGNLLTYGPLTRARHRPIFSWRLTCSVCGAENTTRRCEHDPSFVADVAEEEVLSSALDLLSPPLGS